MDQNRKELFKLLEQRDYPEDAFFMYRAFADRDIVMYGAGECSHWFIEIVMKMHGYKPIAVLDRSFKHGDLFEGVPAFPPDAYEPSDRVKAEAVVVICVGNQSYHGEIVDCLKEIGFKNIIFLMDVYEIHNPFGEPMELTQEGYQFYTRRAERIAAALECFHDRQSREIYVRSIQNHMTRKPQPLTQCDREEQYFPKDIQMAKGYDCFVNCGSYDGDTIRLLNKSQGKVSQIVCFEPETAVYSRLLDYMRMHGLKLADEILCYPCAVYGSETVLPFDSRNGLGSRLSSSGETEVKCVSLDHVLADLKPTFICMDVEGVEMEVLQGGRSLIEQNRPDLAVCVYHNPSHLWDIPLYLNGLDLDYRFYLRNYTGFTIETVLYATTQTRPERLTAA